MSANRIITCPLNSGVSNAKGSWLIGNDPWGGSKLVALLLLLLLLLAILL